MLMLQSTICSIWVATWYQRKHIDISDCVPLRLGKMQRWIRLIRVEILDSWLVNLAIPSKPVTAQHQARVQNDGFSLQPLAIRLLIPTFDNVTDALFRSARALDTHCEVSTLLVVNQTRGLDSSTICNRRGLSPFLLEQDSARCSASS